MSEPKCRSKYGKYLEAFDPKDGKSYELNCGSWRCPKCRIKWSKKWSNVIGQQCSRALPGQLLLVNLTTSEMVDNKAIELALQFFFRKMRNQYGTLEYIKMVEYNRRQTQPHFHLIVRFEELEIPPAPARLAKNESFPVNIYNAIQDFWSEALCYSSPETKLTDVVWCQPPAGDGKAAAAYAVGYIAGRDGKEYELPNATWRGRRVTFSKKFFYTKVGVIWAMVLESWFGKIVKKALILTSKEEYKNTKNLTGQEFNDVYRILKTPNIIKNNLIKMYVVLKPPDLEVKRVNLYESAFVIVDYC